MPNGGSDCCANCSHNRAVTVVGTVRRAGSDWDESKFYSESHCTLRNVNITSPFWTYCRNSRSPVITGGPVSEKLREALSQAREHDDQPIGPIYAGGMREGGYVRIPWYGNQEPLVSVPISSCSVCGKAADIGVVLAVDGESREFCTAKHYMECMERLM